MFRTNQTALFVFIAIIAVLLTSAADVYASDLVVEKPWARASIGVSRPTAVYLTIRNGGAVTDVLTMVTTPAAGMAEVHKSEVKDGLARMSPAGNVEVSAGTTAILEPGGLHIMLMELKNPLKKGETISMTLHFENAGPVDVAVPVYGIAASGPKFSD